MSKTLCQFCVVKTPRELSDITQRIKKEGGGGWLGGGWGRCLMEVPAIGDTMSMTFEGENRIAEFRVIHRHWYVESKDIDPHDTDKLLNQGDCIAEVCCIVLQLISDLGGLK